MSSAIAWIFLDEPLNATQIIAMFVALLAIGVLVRAQAAPRPATETETETENSVS
jgi:drug/metabolite transporter (DMT)-like permease